MITSSSTYREVAFEVGNALDCAGVTAVLTGGGAATLYAPVAYQSRDLDFVFQFVHAVYPPNEQPLLDLGFRRRNSSYAHNLTPLTIDFPPGPLAIGIDLVTEWSTLRE